MKLTGKRKELESGMVRLKFEGEITIYTVARLKKLLAGELKKMKGLEFDLTGVEKFDTSGFQLFLHVKKIAVKNRKSIVFSGVSNDVSKVFSLYGMAL